MKPALIMPYALPEYIDEAVESISTSGAKEFPLFMRKDPGIGVMENRNYLIERACKELPDDTLLVLVDGDDLLLPGFGDVMQRVAESDAWFAYGGGDEYSWDLGPYTDNEWKEIRRASWKCCPVQAFRGFLWEEMKMRDPGLKCLRDNDGTYFAAAPDVALLYPMMEMAGQERSQYIEENIYIRRFHPKNIIRMIPEEEVRIRYAISEMPSWSKIDAQ